MPLSRCRHCGKMIPNIFHKYHEEVQCLVMRQKKGLLPFRKILPGVRKPRVAESRVDHKITEYVWRKD